MIETAMYRIRINTFFPDFTVTARFVLLISSAIMSRDPIVPQLVARSWTVALKAFFLTDSITFPFAALNTKKGHPLFAFLRSYRRWIQCIRLGGFNAIRCALFLAIEPVGQNHLMTSSSGGEHRWPGYS